ncbi:putative Late embryogenesis abundant protein [Helianthus annuus]|nr:putative Late embryogenesis abundant protein [Helianthus annuus]KAJ0746515.1 putative Late embryogenesis abundant protein [Helianthus annuus]KAJ0749587.1 putative Late embryogenesis abundant protein [Helianthus annuus]
MAAKLVINKHLRSLTTARSSICSTRRRLHESAYWEPDPDTGVFVPASEQKSEEPAVSCSTEETVLDEKAFFRPQEDLEAPPPESFRGEIPPVDPFAE